MLDDHREPQVKDMNRATIIKFLAFGLTMAMLLAFAAPAAAETVAAEEPEAEDFYYRRAISEQVTSESAWIASAKQTPQGSDWIVFALNTKGDDQKGLGVGVIYGHGNAAGDWEHATASFIAPFCIVEFRDDGDGRYDLRADDVVSVLPLHADMDDHSGFYSQTGESSDSMTWYERPGYKNVKSERVNGPQDTIEIMVTAETTDGVFALRIHITNSIIFSEDLILSPYEVKIDFVINDYPYVANDTILGLCNIVASANANWNTGLAEVYEDWVSNVEEDGMYFDMGDLSEGVGYFTWYKNASLDGVDTEVQQTTLAQLSAFEWTPEKATKIDIKYVAFTYGRAESIVHDPKLGFAFEGVPAALVKIVRGNFGLFMFSVFLFCGVIYAARWSRRRASTPKRANGKPPTPPIEQLPPEASPQMPQQTPPHTSPTHPQNNGAYPNYPPGQVPGGPPNGQLGGVADPRYGYRPPGQ